MWRWMIPLAAITPCAIVLVAGAAEPIAQWDFEEDDAGKTPENWSIAKTGQGDGSDWRIVEEEGAPSGSKVLAQTAKSPSHLFNLCVADGASYQDLQISAAFKPVAGRIDQGGGLVWRYLDADNYYVARMNPLEGNFRLFRVVNGKRTMIASQDRVAVPLGEWHSMSVSMKGDQIECSLDGKKLLVANDSTISSGGRIGLWSKADAQTYFDNVRVFIAK